MVFVPTWNAAQFCHFLVGRSTIDQYSWLWQYCMLTGNFQRGIELDFRPTLTNLYPGCFFPFRFLFRLCTLDFHILWCWNKSMNRKFCWMLVKNKIFETWRFESKFWRFSWLLFSPALVSTENCKKIMKTFKVLVQITFIGLDNFHYKMKDFKTKRNFKSGLKSERLEPALVRCEINFVFSILYWQIKCHRHWMPLVCNNTKSVLW